MEKTIDNKKNVKGRLVSVIIPVYNVAPYLREALDSVINQTYKKLEIIIIDDGSTDGSGRICDEYKKDPRVIVIHQKNKGLSDARNTGLDLMTGDYVAFLDSDDAFHPEMIRYMLYILKQHNTDLASCSVGFLDANDRLDRGQRQHRIKGPERIRRGNGRSGNGIEKEISSREAIIALIEGSFSAVVWNKVYQKSLWENLRFPEGRVYEDICVILKILERCSRIAVVFQTLMYHRNRRGSITKTYSIQHMWDFLFATRSLHEDLEKSRLSIPPEILHRCHESSMRSLICYWAQLHNSGIHPDKMEELVKEIQKLYGGMGSLKQINVNSA